MENIPEMLVLKLINNGCEYNYDKVVTKLYKRKGDHPYTYRLLKRVGVIFKGSLDSTSIYN